jgi:ribosome-binding protein aMBF1 (putative translation factor)
MNAEKRKALEEAAWKFDAAADFVGMSDDERKLLDARVEMALAIRRLREKMKLSQKDLAGRLKTTQPRIARIARAAPEVSFDQIFRAYAVVGGRLALQGTAVKVKKKPKVRAKIT